MPTIVVYKYGTHSQTTLPDEAIEQLRMANRMRNDLVADALTEEQAVLDLWSSDPAVAAVEEDLTAAEALLATLTTQARAEHATDGTIATRPATAAAITTVRGNVRELRERRRKAIGPARLRLKPELEQIRDTHKANRKQIRQTYADQGLYWGTYNRVLDDHAVARKLVSKARGEGRAAQLRFHRFDGTGTLTIQLQRQAGDPPRTPDTIAEGDGKWRNVLQLTKINADPATVAAMTGAQRRRTGTDRALLTWSIGNGRTFELPVTVHRPMPPDADITGAQLTVRRTGAHTSISVALTARIPDPDPVEGRPAVALHGGWRTRPDGSVRVGAWATTTPVTVPDTLTDVVVAHAGGRWGEIVLPAAWLAYATRPSALRAQRDLNRAPVQAKLADWLDQHPQPGDDDRPDLTGAVVRQWRSPARMAALAIQWRDDPPEGGHDIAHLLEAWRKQDKHLWEWEAHQRAKAVARRDDAWRRVGAWLAEHAGVLVTEDTDLAVLRQEPDPADSDPVLAGSVQRAARNRAVLAAPGALRQFARAAATRRGVAIRVVDAAYLSRTCPYCHTVGDPDPRYAAAAVVVCPTCDRSYDQDHAAATAMLTRDPVNVEP